jgi:hypothetical protein
MRQLVSVVKTSIWEVALPHETSETFDGICRLNVSVQSGREIVKRQQVLFILSQTAHRALSQSPQVLMKFLLLWQRWDCLLRC